jgi:hypothetical protein
MVDFGSVRDIAQCSTREAVMSETRAMAKINAAPAADLDAIVTLIEDAADLTPKELEQECKAKAEELRKLSWMSHSAEELAGRIPVSVFAMGDLVTA